MYGYGIILLHFVNEYIEGIAHMALYYYKKAPTKPLRPLYKPKKEKKPSRTIADVLDPFFERIARKLAKIKVISVVLPVLFILSGIGILFNQIKPYAVHFLKANLTDQLDQEIVPLIPESYESLREAYITDPGASYFTELLNTEAKDPPNSEYTGTFYLTIEKILIFKAPVTANVDSLRESSYQAALAHGLAHFKGTYLPGDSGNVFVYGHSAAGDYADRNPSDVVTAFTRLFKLNIGDKIHVTFEEKEYEYVVKKIKEVKPEDTEILHPSGGGKTLTLMTCSPPGLNSRRLIVVAVQQ